MEIKLQDIKDYLHLYIGQKVWTTHKALNNGEPQALTITINNLHEILYKYEDSKLILRPLSDMTEEEKEEFGRFTAEQWPKRGDGVGERLIPSKERSALWAANQTKWYTSRSFDVFGLIPAGLAIDKTSLKK